MEVLQDTYKDTKIGKIPKDWEVKKLDEVCLIIMGQSPSSSAYNEDAIGLPLVQGNADIKCRVTTPRIFSSQITKISKEGDVIMTVRAPVGAIAKSNIECCIGRGVCAYRVKGIDNEYLYQCLVAKENSWKRLEQGSTFTAVNSKDIKHFKIPFPPLPEQQKIADILSTVDEQISTTNKIIEKSKELKKGLMQKLFSEGIGHTEFKDTKIGRIPKDWEVVKLGDIGTVIDSLHQTPKFSDVGYPMVRVGDINKSKLNLKNCLTVPIDVFKAFTKNHLPTNGDILITRVGSFGKTILVENDSPFCLGQNTAVITGLSNERYVYYMLNSYPILKQIGILTNGSTQPSLSLKEIRNIKVAVGLNTEQQKIADILSEADAKIEKEQTQKVKLETLKKGLMQQLLTGKKRVKV